MKSLHLLTINDSKYYLTESNKEYISNLKEETLDSKITITISKWTDSLKEILPKDLESLPELINIEEKIHVHVHKSSLTSRGITPELNHLVILNPKIISYEYENSSIRQREGTNKKLMPIKEDKEDNTGNIILNLSFTKMIKTNNIESTIRDIKLDTLL